LLLELLCSTPEKNPVMVEAGRKAAITRKTGNYTIEEHKNKVKGELPDVFEEVRNYIMNLNDSIEETPKRNYISYKTSQNFVCLEVQKNKLYLFLKINAEDVRPLPAHCRDVRNIGHFGTGDLEVTLRTMQDFEETKELINLSLRTLVVSLRLKAFCKNITCLWPCGYGG
jgi:predicted transport protein